MCDTDPRRNLLVFRQPPPVQADPDAPAGSRRRRLWELDASVHCPVLGACLPLEALRRVLAKALGGEPVAEDYELHRGAVADCRYRGPVAEAVQRELDRRYGLALRQAARLKSAAALRAWWDEAVRSQDIAGPLWATLTHPRCTPELVQHVEGAVHMLQHQAGVTARADRQRLDALLHENGVLTRELAAAQQRSSRHAAEHARRHEAQQAEILRLRAALIGRETAIAALQEEVQSLEAGVPGLRGRLELARQCEALIERSHELQRQLLAADQAAERQARRAEELARELERRDAERPGAGEAEADGALRPWLEQRAVLCVGGRQGSVPAYRQLVEGTGGRFLHHDGGAEDNAAQLDATLAAADLVICQTGCISHAAYWRVKDHCKRTGKRCVFVENPSSAGLRRALLALVPATQA